MYKDKKALVSQTKVNIMDTAPCKTDRIKPHLYS